MYITDNEGTTQGHPAICFTFTLW